MAKSIKLKNDIYWDDRSIIHDGMLLGDILRGKLIADIDKHFITGFFTYNPNSIGTKPLEKEYGQLLCFSNRYNFFGEEFTMTTQIAIPTWDNQIFIRTTTNNANWTNWRSV